MSTVSNSALVRVDEPLDAFYITNVFWGAEFREYFLGRCLPSLLWPLNLTALANARRNVLLIVTTRGDWEELMRAPLVMEASRHYELEWVELPSESTVPDKFRRCAAGYRMVTEALARTACVGLHLSPDLVVADGTLPELFARRTAGAAVVVIPAWRSELEGFLRALARRGQSEDTGPLSIDRPLGGRELATICAQSVHRFERDRYWNDHGFRDDVGTLWWRVAGDGGWLMHAPTGVIFMDYGRIRGHDVSGLRDLPFDAYPAMFKPVGGSVEGATDSDSLFIASFTPANEPLPAPRSRWQYGTPLIGGLARGLAFRLHVRRMYAAARDEISLRVLARPFRVHARDLTGEWDRVARQAERVIARYVGDLIPADARPAGSSRRATGLLLDLLTLVLLPSLAFPFLWHRTRGYGGVVWSAARGNADARRRILRHIGIAGGRHGSLRGGGA